MKVPKQISIADQELDFERAIADALEKILAPVVEVICEMERIGIRADPSTVSVAVPRTTETAGIGRGSLWSVHRI